jgi:hypothetical protein
MAERSSAKKNVSVNAQPTLRQHQATFFGNFLTKGIAHELDQCRRGKDDSKVVPPEAEVNRCKQYTLGLPRSTNPPYHIAGDDERVRDAGTFCRMREMLESCLREADGDQDGFVTRTELRAVLLRVVDRNLSNDAFNGLFKLLDPENTGIASIAETIGVALRSLSTRPSQRQTIGAGNILGWRDAELATRDPASARAVTAGGATTPRVYYGLAGRADSAVSPEREAHLPGLRSRVAGHSNSARLRQVDEMGGTAAPLAKLPASSPRNVVIRRSSPSHRVSTCTSPTTRSARLRQQHIAAEASRSAATVRGSFSTLGAVTTTYSAPAAAHSPRPGLHILAL